MSSGAHIHVVDGKSVAYPNDACPICKPELAQQQAGRIPNVHRKGMTVVMQIAKSQMSTTTWYAKESCFLHSLRKMQLDSQNKVIRDSQGKPLWTQLTMRINIPLMKEWIVEVEKMMKELETAPAPAPQQTTPTVPQRG